MNSDWDPHGSPLHAGVPQPPVPNQGTARWHLPRDLIARLGGASLRTRLMIIITTAFAAVMATVGFVSYQAVMVSTRQALDERQTVARLMADRVDSHLSSALLTLQRASGDERLNIEDANPEPENALLAEVFANSRLFRRILLLDASGIVRWAEPPPRELIGTDMTVPPYNTSLALGSSPLLVVARGYQTGAPGVQVIYPVPGRRGGIGAYLLGWINFGDERAQTLLGTYSTGDGGFADLVDQTGTVLASSRSDRLGLTTDHAGSFAALISNRSLSVGTCHSCHDAAGGDRENDVLAFAPLSLVPWGIALRQPEAQVFAVTQTLNRDLAVLALVVLLVFATVVSISTRSLARPLEQLARACRQIAHGDLTEPVRVGGVAETRALASSFEKMRRDLLAYRTESENARRHLEQRVDERTTELRQARDHLLSSNRNLIALNAVAAILSQSLDLRETLDLALNRALEAVGAECGLLYVRVSGGEQMLAAHHGLSATELDAVHRLEAPDSSRKHGTWWTAVPESADPTSGLAAALNLQRLLCVPLQARGEELGRICVGVRHEQGLSSADEALLASIASQMALAVRNAGLYDALQREEQARAELLHQVIAAQEDERKRVARELHDETSQAVTALMLGLDTVGLALAHNPEEAAAQLNAARSVAEGMLQDIHRLIADLRPSLLDDLGLMPAISWYAEQRLNPIGVAFHVECDGLDHRLPPHLETAVFRVVQEALTNVVRHAGAANVWLSLAHRSGHISLQVRDDGRGIENGDRPGSDSGGGIGLRGMRERVNLLGGDFRVDSAAGQGTTILVRLPIRGLSAGGLQRHRQADHRRHGLQA